MSWVQRRRISYSVSERKKEFGITQNAGTLAMPATFRVRIAMPSTNFPPLSPHPSSLKPPPQTKLTISSIRYRNFGSRSSFRDAG